MATKLIGLPRVARPLTGRGALPSLANLLTRTPTQLAALLERFGLSPDVPNIEARALRAWERLDEIISEGYEPDDATWELIDSLIQKQVAETLRNQAKAAIRNYQRARLDASGTDLAVWVTVGDANVCASCEPRHGQVETLADWDRLGPPGSGVLVCASECRCVLQPIYQGD